MLTVPFEVHGAIALTMFCAARSAFLDWAGDEQDDKLIAAHTRGEILRPAEAAMDRDDSEGRRPPRAPPYR